MKSKMFILLLLVCCINSFSQNRGNEIVKTENDGFRWIPYMEYGRIGAKNYIGEIIVPAKYETCYYERGHFSVKNNIGESGIFSKDGKILVPTKGSYSIYEIADMKNSSPFIVNASTGYGVYSQTGEEIVKKIYRYVTPYVTSHGIYYVVTADNGFSGLIDANGKILIEPNKFNALIINEFKNKIFISYLIYGDNRSSGICDTSGNITINTKYTYVIPELNYSSNNLYYKISLGNSFGKMSLDGKILEQPIAEKTYRFGKIGDKSFYIVIDENSYFGVADKNKKIVIPCEYDFIEVRDSFLSVKKGCYMGLFNKDFKEIISTQKKYVVTTYIDGKYPYIYAGTEDRKQAMYDITGQLLSEPLYNSINYHVFENTKDTVLTYKQDGLWGAKTIKGKSIFQPFYRDLNFLETPIGNFFYVFNDNNLVGLCNYNGVEIIEPQFTGITFNRKNGKDYFYASNDNYAAIFNTDGTQLINGETFSQIIYDEKQSQFIAIQGKRKCYFTKDGTLIKDNSLNIEQDKYISIADSYFEEGKYKQAAKNYGLALNIIPTASLYFNRGVSYYNMDKYNDAISDFKRCLDSNPSKNLRARSLELIDKSEEYIFQRNQRRANVASAIFGLVLTGANMYFETQLQKQHNKYKTSYTANNNHTSSSHSNRTYNEEQDDDMQSSNTGNSSCASLKVNRGKWYCANTGECGMCNGTGLVSDGFGLSTKHDCTLCGGSGKCKYCQ